MKKKNFVSLVLGTIGGILFALGMCMCLVKEWAAFKQGVVVGVIGALTLGVGMCMVMVWNMMLWSIAVGLAGILLLLMLIPLVKGIEKRGTDVCQNFLKAFNEMTESTKAQHEVYKANLEAVKARIDKTKNKKQQDRNRTMLLKSYLSAAVFLFFLLIPRK